LALSLASSGAAALLRSRHRVPLDWRGEVTRLHPVSEGTHLIQPLSDGGRAELTLDPELQRAAERLLAEANAASGAAVLVSIEDGRVLAIAGRSRATPERNELKLALTAWAPAASVFKLVTSAALLDAGVRPDTRVCYHGGVHSLEADNLDDHPEIDSRCRSLAYGLARSQNAILGRLAHDYLTPASLDRIARALGFGEPVPFELPVAPSEIALPGEPLPFARAAAGFWNSTLSPLHGALLAATIARGGEMPAARLIERIVDGAGTSVQLAPLPAPRRALDPHVAHQVARMMVGTTEWGSARNAFHGDRHQRVLGHVRVAGKTGTLNGANPFVAYSWFVGFAPADQPRVAFAVLLGRDDEDAPKAAEVTRALLASWLTEAPPEGQPLAAR
jgi:cell division protein FtsI/penicillin-binding protein 2